MEFEVDFIFSSIRSATFVAVVILSFRSHQSNSGFQQVNVYKAIVRLAGLAYLFFLTAWVDWFFNVGLIPWLSLALIAFVIIRLGMNRPSRHEVEVFSLGVLTTVMINGIAAMRGVVDVSQGIQHTIAVRYWASADNLLPARMTEGLLKDGPLRPFLLGDWQSSDRPPLLTGVHLMFQHFESEAFFILSSVTVIVFVVAYAIFFRESENHSLSALGAMTVCFVPGVFINEIYTWPKLLAGILSLIAIDSLISKRNSFRLETFPAVALTLGLLSHGSTFFVLPVFVWMMFRQKNKNFALLLVGIKCLIVYLPWFLYQTKFDPPGNRLIIWHLAGKTNSVSTDNPITEIINAYQNAGLRNILEYKFNNIASLFWVTEQNPAIAGYQGIFGLVKTQISSTVFWSIGPFLVVALLLLYFWHSSTYTRRLKNALFAIVLIFPVLEMGTDINSRSTLHVSPLILTLGYSVLGVGFVMRIRLHWLPQIFLSTIPIGTYVFFGFFHGPAEAVGWEIDQPSNYLGVISAAMFVFLWIYLSYKSKEAALKLEKGLNP